MAKGGAANAIKNIAQCRPMGLQRPKLHPLQGDSNETLPPLATASPSPSPASEFFPNFERPYAQI